MKDKLITLIISVILSICVALGYLYVGPDGGYHISAEHKLEIHPDNKIRDELKLSD